MAPPRMVSPRCGRRWRPEGQQPPGPMMCRLHLAGRLQGLAQRWQPFVEPATLGWPDFPSCSEAAALEFGNGSLVGAGSSGTQMETDSGDDLMEGLQIISSDTLARIACLVVTTSNLIQI
jgi:hypothetical protein